jgi:hypothetical protein
LVIELLCTIAPYGDRESRRAILTFASQKCCYFLVGRSPRPPVI